MKVVLESLQRNTSLEEVCRKFEVSSSMVRRWRQAFQQRGAGVKASQRAPADRAKPQGYEPGESPDDLKKRIGELTAQNELLKKSLGLLGKWADSTKWNWLECCVLRTGKNRIRHVGHKYGIAARGKRKK